MFLEDISAQYTVNTGEQNEIYLLKDQYFDEITRLIDAADRNLLLENPDIRFHPHFERRTSGFIPLETDPDQAIRPEDSTYMLLYRDKVVATVTEQRDSFNYVQFSFFNRLADVLKSIENSKDN